MMTRRAFGAVLVALTGLVVLAGPAQAQAPSAPTAVDTSGIPGWIWIVVAVVGLLAVIVVGLRQLKGRGKD
ncbi:hypothetical protein QRX60_35300 [Amycolatopsis mongoliensis]|uniref:Uncharacterized protein n=1 Tax=Amycolatopsis mongoliensis TaxID=715475 RepID=A0A9Y2JIL7_9PSEU|nr:hypothetical protein [Amycolatopsis sp. 4-36]WIX99290.1 hypothetical protein QRX60_35300 [Amycolatopsis sp. 4-36]